MKATALGFLVCLVALPLAAAAAPILPTSYDMLNGNTGSFTYLDDIYNGSGDPNGTNSPLSGGLGKLTDGVIAATNWFVDNTPYVGWDRQVGTIFGNDPTDPFITFHFAPGVTIDSMTLYMDDSNGAGGVVPLHGLSINGGAEIPGPGDDRGDSGLPFMMQLTGLSITGDLTLQLFHDNNWIMISEAQFTGSKVSEVPEPATLGLVGAALAGLVIRRRLRK